jgi:hypothetical protein
MAWAGCCFGYGHPLALASQSLAGFASLQWKSCDQKPAKEREKERISSNFICFSASIHFLAVHIFQQVLTNEQPAAFPKKRLHACSCKKLDS